MATVRIVALLMLQFAGQQIWAQAAPAPAATIDAYIHKGWDSLSRSMSECQSLIDPKVTTPPVLYLPYGAPMPAELTRLSSQCKIDVEHLPRRIVHLGDVKQAELKPGLLYLPKRYVVPGGRFNEMFGWDSYFIILGLLRDGRIDLARGMVENFFYEIENYGAVLNANRTYFLTRSQPPFLSSMIREVYEAELAHDSLPRQPSPAKAVARPRLPVCPSRSRLLAQWNPSSRADGPGALSGYRRRPGARYRRP